MKTRIISGIVMGIIVAVVLAAGFLWNPLIITAAIAVIAAVAIYELLHNAAGIKNKAAWIGACVYTVLAVFTLNSTLSLKLSCLLPADSSPDSFYNGFTSYGIVIILSIIYFIYAVFAVLKSHKDFGLGQIAALCGLPLPYAFAFSCLGGVINHTDGIYYLLLLLNFSSVCDMGAYFTGSFLGKHKLCPGISPKKTVEGAVGGVAASIIVTLIITLCFNKAILLPLILTVPLCILGMIGDLFASAIKRSVGIKDYGKLIPGHGGILDRVDSIIMIVPLMFIMIKFGVI